LNTSATGKKFQKKTRISSQTNYLDLTLFKKIATAAKTINFIDCHLVPADRTIAKNAIAEIENARAANFAGYFVIDIWP
jgi:hypothetical protein